MKIVSLLFLLFVSLTLGAQDITGKWYGYPDLKNMRLRLSKRPVVAIRLR